MPRFLRIYLLGCIAITFGYLLLHAREPLRLNLGDPWGDANVVSSVAYVQQYGFHGSPPGDSVEVEPPTSDTYRPIHYPPLPEIIYTATGYLGVRDIGTFRLLALAFSALAMLLLYQYVRRLWNDSIALIATALCSTSVMWMMFADSIRQVPIVHAAGFLALWGLVRAIDTQQRRHYAAAFFGSCACFLASYDLWLFLPAAVLFTVHRKRGNPFARGSLRFVAVCAAGCVAAILAKALFASGAIGWQASIDRTISSPFATLVRRYTLVFTPLFWIPFLVTVWKGLRATSARSVLDDGMTWMLAIAGVLLYGFARFAGSPMLGAVPLLPFYAIGSAILIARLLEGRRLHGGLAVVWLGLAPIWSLSIMFSHPRSVLARDDVSTVNAYFAANDGNDFVISNLLADGPIQAAFGRRTWAAPDPIDASEAHLTMLDMFAVTGTDYVHAVIFTGPDSRFVDRSLGQLLVNRRLAAVAGWPFLNRNKTNEIIRDYDRRVLRQLDAVHAKKVLHLRNFDVYRIDRASVLEAAGLAIPVVRAIDFGGLSATKHLLLGWGQPWLTPEGIGVTSLDGVHVCANPLRAERQGEPATNACETVMTKTGLKALDEGASDRAQMLIRVERACDLRLTFELAAPAPLGLSVGDFSTPQCDPAKHISFLVPQRSIRAGINVITLETRSGPKGWRPDISSLAIDPMCGP